MTLGSSREQASTEIPALLDAAGAAVAAGDLGSAEARLRQALSLQVATLGPDHPDLANTLNNLGVVCERAGQETEAEACYERAAAVAAAALAPDHPFVLTSRQNLRDFQSARRPSVTPAEASSAGAEHASATRPDRPAWLLPGAAVALVAVGLAVAVMRYRGTDQLPGGPETAMAATDDVRTDAAATPASSTPEVAPPSPDIDETSPPLPSPPASEPDGSPRAVARPRESPGNDPVVMDGRLCSDLERPRSGGWRCAPVALPFHQGAVVFYTRIASPRDTTVEHRWFRGDALQRVVPLRVRSSPADGYRTYTRQRIRSGERGPWRVELRSKDGVLLHEERFVVGEE